jgi:hypothetical protein
VYLTPFYAQVVQADLNSVPTCRVLSTWWYKGESFLQITERGIEQIG